jgi:hypothetical protein
VGAQVRVTAFPAQETVTVAVTGDLDPRSCRGLAALVSQLSTDLVSMLVVDLAWARIVDGVPRQLIVAMRPVRLGRRLYRRALVNVPGHLAHSACAAPQLLWHERCPDAVPWQDAVRLAKPTALTGACDCAPTDHSRSGAIATDGCASAQCSEPACRN